MNTLILEIKNEAITDKILWMLEHFKADGLVIKEQAKSPQNLDIKKSMTQAVNELNMIKSGDLQAKPIEDLLSVL